MSYYTHCSDCSRKYSNLFSKMVRAVFSFYQLLQNDIVKDDYFTTVISLWHSVMHIDESDVFMSHK